MCIRDRNTVVIGAVGCMSAVLLVYLMGKGTSYTYMMGHFPAPWGNEIRAGVLEAGMAPVSYTHLDVYKRQTS